MKRIVLLVIVIILGTGIAQAKGDLIWDYQSDKFIKDVIKGNTSVITGKTSIIDYKDQEKIDKEVSENLDIDLINTNLAECLKVASDNNYTLKQNKSIKEQAYWSYKNANAQYLPDFQYSYSIQKLSGTFLVGGIQVDSVNETPIMNTFTFSWPTLNQGKTIFLNIQKKNEYRAKSSSLNYSQDEVLLNTTLTYYELLRQKIKFDVFRTNLIDRREQLNFTKARFQVGLGDKLDVERAEAEVAKAKQQYIASFNSIRLLQAKLANIMGVDVLDALYPYEVYIETRMLIDEKYSIEDLYQMALVARDDIKASKLMIESLKAQRNSVKMDFAPQVNLLYQKAWAGTARLGLYPNDTIGFSLTAPLGKKFGFDTVTNVKALGAQIEAEQYKLEILQRNVKENITTSYYNSKTSLERIEAAKKEVEASDESLKISIVQMTVGKSTFLDVIQAQGIKVQSRQNLVDSIIDYNKAQVQLLFDAGIITCASVLKNYETPQVKQNKAP